jgi:hypothetical protein
MDYYTPQPDYLFAESLLRAIRAVNTMHDVPERDYMCRQMATSVKLGGDGIAPQSGMRGVNWTWHNTKKPSSGRWTVRDVEHDTVRNFPGTLDGLEQAKAFAASRKLAKVGRPRTLRPQRQAPESPRVGVTWQWRNQQKTRGVWRVYDPATRKARMFPDDDDGLAQAVAFAQSRVLSKARGPGRKRKNAA